MHDLRYAMLTSAARTMQIAREKSKAEDSAPAMKAYNFDTSDSGSDDESGVGSDEVYADRKGRLVVPTTSDFEESSDEEHDTHLIEYEGLSCRAKAPMSDYDNPEATQGFVCAFPMVFILGNAYNRPPTKLNSAQIKHLLLQHNQIAAQDRRLMCFLFDVQKRAAVCQGMKSQVRGSKQSMNKVETLLNNAAFSKRLEFAVNNPESYQAKSLLKEVVPILTFAGRKQSYGALSTSLFLSKMINASKRYGPASGYFTFAFDDINNPGAFQSSFCTVDNEPFPAVFGGDSIEHMKHKQKHLSLN